MGTGKETYYGPSPNAEMTLDEVLPPEILVHTHSSVKLKIVPPLVFCKRGLCKNKNVYLSRDKDKEKVLSTALHELQHAIQTEENFKGFFETFYQKILWSLEGSK